MVKNEKVYPKNNQVSVPFWLKFFIDRGLVDVLIVESGRFNARHPTKVKLVFNNSILKKLLISKYGLAKYSDPQDISLVTNELLISHYANLRSLYKKNKDEELRAKQLNQLEKEYCGAMKASLKTTLSMSLDIVIANGNFDIPAFRMRCNATDTIEGFTGLSIELLKAISDARVIQANNSMKQHDEKETAAAPPPPYAPPNQDSLVVLVPARDQFLVPTKEKFEEPVKRHHTPSSHSHLRVVTTPSPDSPQEINDETKEEIRVNDHASAFSPELYKTPGEEEKEETLTPISPQSPFLPDADLIAFIRVCTAHPIPKNPRIDPADLTCRISGRVCNIPVMSGDKLFDLNSLTPLPDYRNKDCFTDPIDKEVIQNRSLKPAIDVRVKILNAINEEAYFQSFLIKYKEDYDKSYFRWSNFNVLLQQNKMNNFKDLFKYVTENPSSRSARVFASMAEEFTNPFNNFMKKYLKDYQSSYFHRSIFLKDVKKHKIHDMDTTQTFATAPDHLQSRTARVLRTFRR